MDTKFNLKIVTVDKELVNEEVTSFTTKNPDGLFQILPNHSPLISLTSPSHTEYIDLNGEKHSLFTSQGIMKLNDNNLVMIVNSGEHKEEIDVARAKEALNRAKELLYRKVGVDIKRAQKAFDRAKERIKTVEG